MTAALEDHEGTVSIGGRTITNLRFADDIDGLAGEEELAKLVERLDKAFTSYDMEISAEETKLMTNNTNSINTEIKVNGQKLETVTRFFSYKDHVTNEEVCAKIQQATGPHEDLLTIIKRRKLQRCGHVFRPSGLAKTILQGTVKGGRRQGGQKKRLEDNIKEWTGLESGKSQRAAENREKWRKLVAKSSVVPQRPSRLRN